MKNLIGSFLLLLITCSGFAQEIVKLKVKQDYQFINQKDGKFVLAKKPFALQFHVMGMSSFCIGITQDRDVYESAIGKGDLEVVWFESTAMAEDLFNETKETLISNDAASYWFFDAIDDHRFDKHPQGTQKDWVAERSIQQFYLVEQATQVPVSKINKPVFLVIYQPIYDEEYHQIDQKLFYHTEINWKN